MSEVETTNPPENATYSPEDDYRKCRGIPRFGGDCLRNQAATAVGSLIQTGQQARRLFVLVMGLAACRGNEIPYIDRLGALLTSWEDHEPGGELEGHRDYWKAVATMSYEAHSEIFESNELELGNGEVLLWAIGEAASRRFNEVSGK
jgi:hypothetical protein